MSELSESFINDIIEMLIKQTSMNNFKVLGFDHGVGNEKSYVYSYKNPDVEEYIEVLNNWNNEMHEIPLEVFKDNYPHIKITPEIIKTKPKLDPFRAKATIPTSTDGVDMQWKTQDGKTIMASQMETRHMFYALRLLYNKSVPPQHRVGSTAGSIEVNSHRTNQEIQEQRFVGIRTFFHLLTQPHRESEITDKMFLELSQMQKVVREIL